MAILTFMSDFGLTDGYVASVKGKVLTALPTQPIVDISHSIKPFDIAHGSFVLRSVFRDFPVGTTHIVAVNSTGSLGEAYIAVELEGHYFFGTDNGLLSLISEVEPSQIVILGSTEEEVTLTRQTTFPARDVLAPAVVKYLQGAPLSSLGEATTYFNRMLFRQPRVNPKLIAGHVVYIDSYGNLITNIRQADLDALEQAEFIIKIGREEITKIHRSYSLADAGDLFGVFNSQGFLELGIHSGNAAELLGMEYDSPVLVRLLGSAGSPLAERRSRLSGRLPL